MEKKKANTDNQNFPLNLWPIFEFNIWLWFG